MCVDDSLAADGFFAEVDQQACAVASVFQVEQALFDVLVEDFAARLGFQQYFIVVIPDHEIDAPAGDDLPVVFDRNFDLALELYASFL